MTNWRALGPRAFPGTRAVWLAALVVSVVAVAAIGKSMAKQSLPLTGSNSVDIGAVIGQAQSGELTCIRNLVVPSGSGRAQLWLGLQRPTVSRPRISGTISTIGGAKWRIDQRLDANPAGYFRDLKLDQVSNSGASTRATFCFRVTGSAVDLGGATVNAFPGYRATTINGVPLATTDVAVRFLTKRHTGSRLISRVDDAFARAALFKHFPGGSAFIWLLAIGLGLGVPYLVVRTAATADRLSVRSLSLRATGVAAVAGIAWACMLSPLHGADEAEHLAYAQRVAESWHRADAAPGGARQPYSSDEQVLMGAIRHSSTVLNDTSRVRWDAAFQRDYQRAESGEPSRGNGGGFTESASGHSPLYYSLAAVPYTFLASGLDLAELNVAMRVFTALLASLIAGLAVWCAALLLPNRQMAWWLAGMLVALQPVFSSISGTVNNDTLVNLLAAISLVLVIHAWRNGPQPRYMAALGLSTVLLPVAKVTGFAIWPAIAFGMLLVAATHRRRDDLVRLAVMPAAGMLALAAWIFVVAPLVGGDQGALLNVHTSSPTAAPNVTVGSAGITRLEQLNYLVQTAIPFIHISGDVWIQKWPLYTIYVERGYGRFGWLDAGLPFRVLQAVTVALILGWLLALASAVMKRQRWRDWLPGATILALSVLSVLAFVGLAYATPTARLVPGEQGRYIFPALVPMAVLLVGGLDVFHGRARAWAVGSASVALPAFAFYAWLMALTDYYT